MKIANRHITNRTVYIAAGIGVVLLVVYFAVVPTIIARNYMDRVDRAATQARAATKALTTGSNIVIFQDPDVPLSERQRRVAQALSSIKKAQNSLDELHTANTLITLPGNGFAGAYHKATVRHERAEIAVRQSHQVLDEYAKSLAYINAYTTPQLHLQTHLQYVNSVRDFNTLIGQGSAMQAVAAQLQADYNQLHSLTPPPDFASLHKDTLALLAHSAAAFERLGQGLDSHSDTEIYGATATLEQITATTESYGTDSLTELAQHSPTLQQLAELPEKIEHVEGI